jgi:signal transduction histidine kinase
LQDIHASGSHVMSLVNDLLDLSKIEAGKLELNFGAVDANRIVSECISLMQPQANRDRVIIRSSLAQRLPNIVADERSLRQIVLNLLSNAAKFTVGGAVGIEAQRVAGADGDGDRLVFRVYDTGIGMDPEVVARLFQPFTQADPSTTREFGGTGLGLCISANIATLLGGGITVASAPGKGSVFTLTAPAIWRPETDPADAPSRIAA